MHRMEFHVLLLVRCEELAIFGEAHREKVALLEVHSTGERESEIWYTVMSLFWYLRCAMNVYTGILNIKGEQLLLLLNKPVAATAAGGGWWGISLGWMFPEHSVSAWWLLNGAWKSMPEDVLSLSNVYILITPWMGISFNIPPIQLPRQFLWKISEWSEKSRWLYSGAGKSF